MVPSGMYVPTMPHRYVWVAWATACGRAVWLVGPLNVKQATGAESRNLRLRHGDVVGN